jgi:hypothetical protein
VVPLDLKGAVICAKKEMGNFYVVFELDLNPSNWPVSCDLSQVIIMSIISVRWRKLSKDKDGEKLLARALLCFGKYIKP